MGQEIVITDKNTARGTPLGEHPQSYLGLTPVAHQLHDLTQKVSSLERDSDELHNIRATLLLNFGQGAHNRHGFAVGDGADTTHQLLMIVLEQLCRQAGSFGKKPEEKKEG